MVQYAAQSRNLRLYAVLRCVVLNRMLRKPPKREPKSRLSVGLTDAELGELIALKDRHSVSMAWLGRRAIVEFIAKYQGEHTQLPLKLSNRSTYDQI